VRAGGCVCLDCKRGVAAAGDGCGAHCVGYGELPLQVPVSLHTSVFHAACSGCSMRQAKHPAPPARTRKQSPRGQH
jgi:hypothetical protein